MRIVATSDLHGHLPTSMPSGDVAVIAGDICPDFEVCHEDQQFNWFTTQFLPWASELDVKALIWIWGNHDWLGWAMYRQPDGGLAWHFRDALAHFNGPKPICLMDSAFRYSHNGVPVTFYGIPWVPTWRSWAFMTDDTDSAIGVKFHHMPNATNVLITHGPPEDGNFLSHTWEGNHAGSRALTQFLRREMYPDLRTAICGHIHEGYGLAPFRRPGQPDIDFYNVAYVDSLKNPRNKPVIIDLEIER